MIKKAIASVYWKFSRWDLVTEPAPTRPSVLIGAPHTSNWDFILMLNIAWKLGINMRWLGKKSLFKGIGGPFMRMLGGIPVDRENPSKVVGEVVSKLKKGQVISLVVTPDGTRTNTTNYWKSGFYRIAKETDMPVVLGYVDRATMTTGLGETIEITGDVSADMDKVRAFYADKAGFDPAKKVTPRLREEDAIEQ